MSESILRVALILAYGPFAVMALLYLVSLVMKLAGDGEPLRTLVARTSIPEPVKRDRPDDLDH